MQGCSGTLRASRCTAQGHTCVLHAPSAHRKLLKARRRPLLGQAVLLQQRLGRLELRLHLLRPACSAAPTFKGLSMLFLKSLRRAGSLRHKRLWHMPSAAVIARGYGYLLGPTMQLWLSGSTPERTYWQSVCARRRRLLCQHSICC